MRFEYKYLIPISELDQIKSEMLPFLVLNEYAAQREKKEYTVRSIYFDTLLWRYYFEKIEGIKVRKKLRIRGYDNYSNDKKVFLEIKRKNENHTSKDRSSVLFRDLAKFFEEGNAEDFLISSELVNQSLQDTKKFLFHFVGDGLRPTTLVTYEREPYYYKFDRRLRITFDKDLRYLSFAKFNDLFEEEKLVSALGDKIIIEIKFNHSFPIWLRDLLSRHRLQRMALSKYTICMDEDKKMNRVNRHKRISISNSFQSQIINQVEKQNA